MFICSTKKTLLVTNCFLSSSCLTAILTASHPCKHPAKTVVQLEILEYSFNGVDIRDIYSKSTATLPLRQPSDSAIRNDFV